MSVKFVSLIGSDIARIVLATASASPVSFETVSESVSTTTSEHPELALGFVRHSLAELEVLLFCQHHLFHFLS